jgi:F-type H+-transporting ATPase subunit b
MANAPEVFTTDPSEAHTEVDAGAAKHIEPTLMGLAPFQWVSIAMVVLLLIAFFVAKVHKTIGGSLDSRIAAIREQLDEAKKLRAEAEALRDEYAAKIADAQKDAEAMLANARTEADAVLQRAEEDSAEMIARRERMAQDKIAAAERDAVQDVRNRAARAATAASRKLILEQHDAAKDRELADEIIAGL